MNEKLNIAEILKDCPKGMELDCAICDNVYLDEVTPHMIKCYIKNDVCNTIYFHHDGTYLYTPNAKCVIFPKGKTTWEGFQRPFKDGDVVVNASNKESNAFIYKGKDDYHYKMYVGLTIGCAPELVNGSNAWVGVDSEIRFATEEEKQKLFDAIKANGYKWNPETKTLEKLIKPKFKVGDRIKHRLTGDVYKVLFVLSNGCGGGVYDVAITNKIGKSINIKEQDSYDLVPNKFDITTLKPFESRILVRSSNDDKWRPAIFGFTYSDKYYTVGGFYWEQCIPYEGNEHLLGTTNDCDDY